MSQARVVGRIRAGMGGWNYEPWRKTFYPKDVAKTQELRYASRQVTAIEVNGTFYRLQSPAVFAKWRDETPDDFVFSLKAPRFLMNRRDLRTAAEGLARFIDSGLSQLQTKLGPLLWQLAPTKQFDAAEIDGFLGMLPREVDGIPLRHAFEVRHDSFLKPEYLQIARNHRVATVFADTDEHPSFADVTADFIYARLMRTVATESTGYAKTALATWARRAGQWASGEDASGLPRVEKVDLKEGAREVFMFFISGAKERAPAAAQHLLSLLDPR
ncbi:MAG TPA: DUF72 domain-containing protein [Steroidobacteraceae bacterium]|nr:DUF72 domain-containing protein [Steroidobacteraceae bacterium]